MHTKIEIDIDDVIMSLKNSERSELAEKLASDYLEVSELVDIAERKGSYDDILDCIESDIIIEHLKKQGYKIESI